MDKRGQALQAIVQNVEQVIKGKRRVVECVLMSLLCEGHVLIEDVPGVGKTTLVAALAKSIGIGFKRIQFTPDILPSDITGFSMYNPKTGEFDYKEGSVFAHFVIADELNRTSPKTQASLLEVMEEHQVSVDGNTYPLPKPFMVLATQNPSNYLGTFALPEAQLDRFIMKLSIGYPEENDEKRMLEAFKLEHPLAKLQPVTTGDAIVQMQEEVKQVYVEESLHTFIIQLIQETRRHQDVLLGASPRGSLALYRAAQASAYMEGRSYVLPEDIMKVAPFVLVHRIQIKHEAKLRQLTEEKIILAILDQMKLPKVKYYEKK